MRKKEEQILREFIRNKILLSELDYQGIMKQVDTIKPYVSGLIAQFQVEESDEDENEEDGEVLEEEIGRNYQTLDTDPYSWKDVDGVDVTTYASADGKWSARVECEEFPSLSTNLTSFNDEAEAEHWARMQAEKMIRAMMNKK